MNRRQFTLGALSLVGGATFAKTAAADARSLVPGRDYEVLDAPLPPPDLDTIEVLHSFAFGLRPCYDFHRSTLVPWERDHAPDVKLVRVHPYWAESWDQQQKALCTMQALHNEAALVMPAFRTYLIDRRDIFSEPSAFTGFLESLGYDRARALAVYHSSDVRMRMRVSSNRMYRYKMPTSSIIVDGRFRVDPSPTMMSTVDTLVQYVRDERAQPVASAK